VIVAFDRPNTTPNTKPNTMKTTEDLIAYILETVGDVTPNVTTDEAKVVADVLIGQLIQDLPAARIKDALEEVRDQELWPLEAYKVRAYLLAYGWVDCGGGDVHTSQIIKWPDDGSEQEPLEIWLSLSKLQADYAVAMAKTLASILEFQDPEMPMQQMLQMFGPAPNWTTAQGDAAEDEGWNLYFCGKDTPKERYNYCLLKYAESNEFESQEEAAYHVWTQAKGHNQLCLDALTFLEQHVPAEYRRSWVDAVSLLIRKTLATPDALREWLEAHNPESIIGWMPIENFLHSLGIDRVDVTVGHVDIYFRDEETAIPVLGVDPDGNTLPNEMPTWLADFVYEMGLIDVGTAGALLNKHAIALIDKVTGEDYYPTDKNVLRESFKEIVLESKTQFLEAVEAMARSKFVQWEVTKDVLDINKKGSDVSICSVGFDPALRSLMTARFRCRDDDKKVYFEGVATPATEFEPLEAFCKPDSGCTEIQWFEDGAWKTL
jgi:hypothetical protein